MSPLGNKVSDSGKQFHNYVFINNFYGVFVVAW